MSELISVRERIIALYGEKMLRKSALRIRGGGGVFERVMSGKGYRTALEIGTYRGCAAAEMSRYCERVITIDLRYGKMEQNGERLDRAAFWHSIGVHNVELVLVDDDADKRKIIDTLDFDFAFIDGGHDDASVRADFSMVRRCGNVLFHDADDNRLREHKPNASNHVYEFIETLPKEQIEFMDIFAMWKA